MKNPLPKKIEEIFDRKTKMAFNSLIKKGIIKETNSEYAVVTDDADWIKPENMPIVDNSVINREIAKILDIFYRKNNSFNFKNRGFRVDLEELLNQYGYDTVEVLTTKAVALQFVPYAPIITNPTQLKNKLAELIAFSQREAVGNNKFTSI